MQPNSGGDRTGLGTGAVGYGGASSFEGSKSHKESRKRARSCRLGGAEASEKHDSLRRDFVGASNSFTVDAETLSAKLARLFSGCAM